MSGRRGHRRPRAAARLVTIELGADGVWRAVAWGPRLSRLADGEGTSPLAALMRAGAAAAGDLPDPDDERPRR